MKLKAVDTLHVSSVKADNIVPGEEFEVSDDFGRQMVERGLATEVAGKKSEQVAPAPAPVAKVDPPLQDKKAPAPATKSKKKGK